MPVRPVKFNWFLKKRFMFHWWLNFLLQYDDINSDPHPKLSYSNHKENCIERTHQVLSKHLSK